MTALRVLVVDDTVTYRRIVSDALTGIPGVEVIGTANTGTVALDRIRTLRPDVVTLDIEMPGMSGLEVLEAIQERSPEVGVVMVSSFTQRGGAMTMRALELGAFDFVTKTMEGSPEAQMAGLRRSLGLILTTYGRCREVRTILRGPAPARQPAPVTAPPRPQPVSTPATENKAANDVELRMLRIANRSKPLMVVIGVSTGGPNALNKMLPGLPGDLGVPVLIVQHMPPLFTASLAESLRSKCALRVKEAEDQEDARPNSIYIAPGGRQMKVAAGERGQPVIRITDDPPENNCRPAADYLFRSAAYAFPGQACGVIMTGMGSDGTLGLRLLKRAGAQVIAQDESSCVVFGMPKEAIAAGVVDAVVPLDDMAAAISKAVKGI